MWANLARSSNDNATTRTSEPARRSDGPAGGSDGLDALLRDVTIQPAKPSQSSPRPMAIKVGAAPPPPPAAASSQAHRSSSAGHDDDDDGAAARARCLAELRAFLVDVADPSVRDAANARLAHAAACADRGPDGILAYCAARPELAK